MSIEKTLREELRYEARGWVVSPETDAAVLAAASPALAKRRIANSPKRSRYVKPVLIAACVLVVLSGFGFGMQRLYLVTGNEIQLHAYTDASLQLTRIEANEVRSEVERVKSQLPVGGNAVIYFAAFAEEANPVLKNVPGVGVSRPAQVTSLTEWKSIVAETSASMVPPERVAGNFVFASGFTGAPFSGLLGPEGMQTLRELQRVGEETGQSSLWRIVDEDPTGGSFLSTEYRNEDGEQLFLTAQLLQGGEKLSVATKTREHVAVTVDGTEVQFTSAEHMLSPTGTLRSATWIGGDEAQPVLYQLSSASERWTAAELLSAAEELIP